MIHYTAADDLIDGDPGEHADQLDEYMRAMQKSYVDQRGYSLGYCVAIDWLGGSWEVRGWDIRSAANRDHNEHTWPILMLVDGNDKATDHAVAAVNSLIYQAEQRAGRKLTVVGHGQLQNPNHPTSCPGAGLRSQISQGAFKAVAPAPTPPPPLPGDEDMSALLWRHPKYLNVFLIGAGQAINVSPQVYNYYTLTLKVPVIVEAHDQLLKSCLFQSGLTTADLVPVG